MKERLKNLLHKKTAEDQAPQQPGYEDSKIKYTIDKKSFFGHAALLMLAMSAIFRIIGCWGLWTDRVFAVMHIILPVSCCVLLMLCIVFLGRKGFFLSFIPVILGVIFFIYKSFSFESTIHTVLCIVLYLSVAIIYTGTMLGSIPTKWLLPPLFGLPFIYHIFVEDLPALSNTAQPVTFSAGMQEMSVLCTMAALFFIGMGLKKHLIPRETVILAEPALADMPIEPPQTEPDISLQGISSQGPYNEAVPAPSLAVPAAEESGSAPEALPVIEIAASEPVCSEESGGENTGKEETQVRVNE